MTSGVEFEGKSVDHAVDEASKQLKIKKDNLKYDVLSYGSSGIFGLVGTKKARIRVNVPEKSRTNVVEKKKDDAIREEPVAKPADSGPNPVHDTHTPVDDETLSRCKIALQKILAAITDDATLTVEIDSQQILFNVSGGNAGVLIGKRGQTLEAIQYLIEKIAGRQKDHKLRVQVDVEGYLKTRRENLEKLADRLAQKALRTGKPMTIGQMNAHDRRIVHLSLKGNSEVRTQSLGEGPYRKLMLFPKKKERQGRNTPPDQ